jgi:hypothetical protein
MNEKYQDFIGMYSDVFPDGFCDFMIKEYELLEASGYCKSRKQSEKNIPKAYKEDTHCFLNMKVISIDKNFNGNYPNDIIFNTLQKYFDKYVEQYDVLKEVNLSCNSLKMQKTIPGAGYHMWHFEQGNSMYAARCLSYAFYLNTIDEAGETEFLYQKIRIPAKENTLLIWPASYTHPHRGNVVYGNKPKYIITGWFYLT